MKDYQSAKETLKSAVNLVELIGQYVQLKKAGQNYMGLCPFHSEKAPSFTVNSARQMFHCFGCKKGGDVFAFWMEYHQVSFPQALEDLAEKYHITIPMAHGGFIDKRKKDSRDALFQVNEIAANYFHDVLIKSEKGEPGRRYFTKRGIPREMIIEFKLGFAPNTWDHLTRRFQGQGLVKAAEAGLIIAREKRDGYYDRFRGRVIFPIFNIKGQTIGFGGRVLDDSLPKYLNSPETPVFQKGKSLYGLHLAYQVAKKNQRIVIVEGYTDALALRKHGFIEVVATLGTALTKDHIRLIKGYVKEAIVVFDSDTAGRTAAVKSLPLFLAEGLPARVMILPDHDDPDTFFKKHDLEDFHKLLEQAVPIFDFYLDQKLSSERNVIENQVDILKEAIPILLTLNNAALQSYYIQRLAGKMGISEAAIMRELRKWNQSRMETDRAKELKERITSSKTIVGDDVPLLNLIIHHPETIEQVLSLDYQILLTHPSAIEIFNHVAGFYRQNKAFSIADLTEQLDTKQAGEYLREATLAPSIYSENMVEQALLEFEKRIKKIKLNDSIVKARERGDLASLNQMLKLKKRAEPLKH